MQRRRKLYDASVVSIYTIGASLGKVFTPITSNSVSEERKRAGREE